VEHQAELNKPDKNGVTLREHLEQVERQTGKRPMELNGPEFPTLLSHIWSAFIHLSSTRGVGMSGALPITYTEIKDYEHLMGIDFSPRDVESIKRLDAVYLRTING